MFKVRLEPIGREVNVGEGGSLADVLVSAGVEFPCGGRGRCRGCRIRVVKGELSESPADLSMLSAAERREGWRLACQARVRGDLTIELRQWSGLILADDSAFAFEPRKDLGLAVDVGTTTLVAQLLDLAKGRVLGTETALNPQARFGADVMSRVEAAVRGGGAEKMRAVVREAVAGMASRLSSLAPAGAKVGRAALVGNAVMHHLFLGHDPAPFAAYPISPRHLEGARLRGAELGWAGILAECDAYFLPNIGGFVGSDILAGILATRLHESKVPVGLADLGTNGEIVVGDRGGLVAASTAAGPAFEGARISQGMRAAPGAVDRVTVEGGKLRMHVIGGAAPAGVCGSGLVDAVMCGRALGKVDGTGRLAGPGFELAPGLSLTQQDIREVQLAKGAIAAGIEILLRARGWSVKDIREFHIAGAFGNSIDPENARTLGLVPFGPGVLRASGNTALLGAKVSLFLEGGGGRVFEGMRVGIRHVSLETSPDFQDLFADRMSLAGKG